MEHVIIRNEKGQFVKGHAPFQGEDHPNWKGGFPKCKDCGKKVYYGSEYCLEHFNIGERNPAWKNGKHITTHGYIKVKKRDHRFADKQGYVPEHRLVVEEFYNICLLPNAQIHHVNGIKSDNRIENLEILSATAHQLKHKIGERNAMFGKPPWNKGLKTGSLSKSTRKKISKELTGRKGKPMSQETKDKLSLIVKKWWKEKKSKCL